MSDAITAWLVAWFGGRGPVPGATLAEQRAVGYFEAGLLDSMGVIELIGAVEERYRIRFEPHHFQDRRFARIGGLAEIIAECEPAPGPGTPAPPPGQAP